MSCGGVLGDAGGGGAATATGTASGDAAHGGGSVPAVGGCNHGDGGVVLQPTHNISAFALSQQACRQAPLMTPFVQAQLQMPGNMAAYPGLMEAAAAAVFAGGAIAGGGGGMAASILPAPDGGHSAAAPDGGGATSSIQFPAAANAAGLTRLHPERFVPATVVPQYSFQANGFAGTAITGGLPLVPFLSCYGSDTGNLCLPKHFQTAAAAAIDGAGGNMADPQPDAMLLSVSPPRQSVRSGTTERTQAPAAAPSLQPPYGGRSLFFSESYGGAAGGPASAAAAVSLPLPPKLPGMDLSQAHSVTSPLASPGTSPRSQLPPPLPLQLAVPPPPPPPVAAARTSAPSAGGLASALRAADTAATGLAAPPSHHIQPIAAAVVAGPIGTYGGRLGLLQLASGNEADALQHGLRPHNESLQPRPQPPSQLQQPPPLPQEQPQPPQQLRLPRPFASNDNGADIAGTSGASSGASGGGNFDEGGFGGNGSTVNSLQKKARVALSHPMPLRGILPYSVGTAFKVEDNVGGACVGRQVAGRTMDN
ncbi:hypothetical protein Vretimale_10624 [Volvox reticuliferus]|nr:hypothetical protein Vretimale_10624 [Volvox reticuliferus]